MSCPMPAWSSAARPGVPSPAGSMPSRCATRSSGSIDMKNSGPTGFPVLPHSWRKSHGNPNRHETESHAQAPAQSAAGQSLRRTASQILDAREADIWVMDPRVEYVDEIEPMTDTQLERVRGVNGVDW